MARKKFAFHFKQGVDQENDEEVDKVNEVLVMMFGEDVFIDWRDEHEVWITTDEGDQIEDRTWSIER